MKKQVSKGELRSEIDKQVAEYLDQGGQVEHIDRGISGREPGDDYIKPTGTLFSQPPAPRTLVPEVVAALESRRRPAKPPARRSPRPQARKVPVYDDFGEVVRWVWQEPGSGHSNSS
jgi:hypothetical protein